MIREFFKEEYLITTDKLKIDMSSVHAFISNESYWAKNIPLDVLSNSIKNSLTFSMLHNSNQIGFARVITDFSTFAYLADVYIIQEYRKRGLSKWLLKTIVEFPELQGLRRWMLMTLDAQELYKKYGFKNLKYPERAMEIANPDVYTNTINQSH